MLHSVADPLAVHYTFDSTQIFNFCEDSTKNTVQVGCELTEESNCPGYVARFTGGSQNVLTVRFIPFSNLEPAP